MNLTKPANGTANNNSNTTTAESNGIVRDDSVGANVSDIHEVPPMEDNWRDNSTELGNEETVKEEL